MKHHSLTLALIASAFALTACSSTSTDKPTKMFATAETTIEQAAAQGADQRAPVSLSKAKEHLRQAQRAVDEEQYTTAKMLLEKAIVEAEYASIKANSEKSKEAAMAVKNSIQTLEQTLDSQR